jgi:hypothetical protein
LRAWKAQTPFDQEQLFAERLALDSLSERDLLYLLAERPEYLKSRVGAVPDWLGALREAFTGADPSEDLLALLGEVAVDNPLAGCLPALGPLLQRALTSLDERAHELREQYGHVPVPSETLARAFLTNIAPTLLFQVSKPLVLEMHIARLQGRLRGDTPEARFEHFMRQLREESVLVSTLFKYPVLARQLVVTVDQWADYLCELLSHLCADWEAICTTFSAGSEPGSLLELDAGKGDTHRRGRSVLLLRFGGGMQLLYKPKPLAVDVHFQELLSWLNDLGAEPQLRTIKLIDRGAYGWSEFVAASPCSTEGEVARFYERQGSYLALVYALDGADLHNENLVAAGEHPVLVDLEALFHPHVYGEDPVLVGNLAAGALDQSVWQVGILPRRIWSDEESLGVVMSGLGGQPGQRNPHAPWPEPRRAAGERKPAAVGRPRRRRTRLQGRRRCRVYRDVSAALRTPGRPTDGLATTVCRRRGTGRRAVDERVWPSLV